MIQFLLYASLLGLFGGLGLYLAFSMVSLPIFWYSVFYVVALGFFVIAACASGRLLHLIKEAIKPPLDENYETSNFGYAPAPPAVVTTVQPLPAVASAQAGAQPAVSAPQSTIGASLSASP